VINLKLVGAYHSDKRFSQRRINLNQVGFVSPLGRELGFNSLTQIADTGKRSYSHL
jgi:hypothetical protein